DAHGRHPARHADPGACRLDGRDGPHRSRADGRGGRRLAPGAARPRRADRPGHDVRLQLHAPRPDAGVDAEQRHAGRGRDPRDAADDGDGWEHLAARRGGACGQARRGAARRARPRLGDPGLRGRYARLRLPDHGDVRRPRSLRRWRSAPGRERESMSTFLAEQAPVTTLPGEAVPYVIEAGSGRAHVLLGEVARALVGAEESSGAMSVMALDGPKADRPIPLHYHDNEYEFFYCLRGAVQLWADDESRVLQPGDFGYVPP